MKKIFILIISLNLFSTPALEDNKKKDLTPAKELKYQVYLKGKKIIPYETELEVGDTITVNATALTHDDKPAVIFFHHLGGKMDNKPDEQKSQASRNITVTDKAGGELNVYILAKDNDNIGNLKYFEKWDIREEFHFPLKNKNIVRAKELKYSVYFLGEKIDPSQTVLEVGDVIHVTASAITDDKKPATISITPIGGKVIDGSSKIQSHGSASRMIKLTESIEVSIFAKGYHKDNTPKDKWDAHREFSILVNKEKSDDIDGISKKSSKVNNSQIIDWDKNRVYDIKKDSPNSNQGKEQ